MSKSVPEEVLNSYIANGALHSAESGLLINDLEPPSFTCEPLLLEIKQYIQSYVTNGILSGVMMSGSGTSIYALERPKTNLTPTGTTTTTDSSSTTSRSTSSTGSSTGNVQVQKFDPKPVLAKFPTLRHFECRFINKPDDVQHWFEV